MHEYCFASDRRPGNISRKRREGTSISIEADIVVYGLAKTVNQVALLVLGDRLCDLVERLHEFNLENPATSKVIR